MNAVFWVCVWAGHVARTLSDELADAAVVLENLAGELAPWRSS